MKHTYSLKGMTCGGCKASVEKHLSQIDGVSAIEVSLENEEVSLSLNKNIAIEVLQNILPQKFSITEIPLQRTSNQKVDLFTVVEEQSKLKQLQPLLIILFYILGATLLLHYKNWDISAMMLDFMGLFFIVFSFFKMLDLKNFPSSFRMYDPLAKKIPFYAWMYPFIETALGLLFLLRFEITIALYSTLVILGITTIGVTKTLLDKKSIQCACLGTALKLPMTEATFIENTIMLVMESGSPSSHAARDNLACIKRKSSPMSRLHGDTNVP